MTKAARRLLIGMSTATLATGAADAAATVPPVGSAYASVSKSVSGPEADCAEQARRTVVETRFDAGGVVFDGSRSAIELTAMKSTGGRWRTSGLTTSRMRLGITASTRVLQGADGRTCVWPRFEVSVTLLPQRVHIGREFARGSCAHDEIVGHEMRHVQANREHAARVTREFEESLRVAFAGTPLYGDAMTIDAQLVRVLESDWLPRLKMELERDDPSQAAIDTEAEFERLSQVCAGAIPALIEHESDL